MHKLITTIVLILLASQSSFAQTQVKSDPQLLSNIESRMAAADQYGKKFATVADSAGHAFLACLGIESFAVGALTGGASVIGEVGVAAATTTSTGIVGPIWIASAGTMGAAVIPGATQIADSASHSFKDLPIRTREWLAPLVAKINSSHQAGAALTLKLINQNMGLLRDERMKILTTTLSGSLKSEIQDRLTCGYLSKVATAKLAEIAATEYRYLRAVDLALTRGYPVQIQNSAYSQGASYQEIFDEMIR